MRPTINKQMTSEEAARILDVLSGPPKLRTMKKRKWYEGVDFGEWLLLAGFGIPVVCGFAVLIALTVLFIAFVFWALMQMF